jgi:hypothetical protein
MFTLFYVQTVEKILPGTHGIAIFKLSIRVVNTGCYGSPRNKFNHQ